MGTRTPRLPLRTISDSAMLSAAMRSGAVASRQKEQRRRQETGLGDWLRPDSPGARPVGSL